MKFIIYIVVISTLIIQIKCQLSTYTKNWKTEKKFLERWDNFKAKHKKNYFTNAEEDHRFEIFKENLKYIDEHNRKHEDGQSKYKLGVNNLSDLTHDEYVQKMLQKHTGTNSLYDGTPMKRDHESVVIVRPKNVVPDEMDWRNYDVVSPVKHQDDCGGCWAFAATGAIESQFYMKHNEMVLFSEQNLIDCNTEHDGCDGGLAYDAFRYVKDFGINSEYSYPYENQDRSTCRQKMGRYSIKIDDFGILQRDNETNLKFAVAEIGPIAISYLVKDDFQFFTFDTKVYYHEGCSTGLHHAMLIVGYGTEDGDDYWLLKNSWGPEWGDGGYVKVARNMENNCGIANNAVFARII